MSTSVRTDIADHIRYVDVGNELSPTQLGGEIAVFLHRRGVLTNEATGNALDDFAEEQNRGAGYRHPKPLDADALAAAVVDRFNLDREV